MVNPDNLRYTKIALNSGSGAVPALGFGTLIADPVATRTATKEALETGFRSIDASERYRNEKEVSEAMQEEFKAGKIKREDLFVATKLWNNNHRPERVKPVFEAKSQETQTRLRRSLSHPHPLCLPARRRARPEGRERQRDL
jgi:diketogulonate reductase-like aldo/keto reductase